MMSVDDISDLWPPYIPVMFYEEVMEALKNLVDKLSEQVYEVVSAISEALYSYGIPLEEFAESLSDAVYDHTKSEIMSPRQYGISLQKGVRRMFPKYPYIPIAPKNRPYQRRPYW